MTESVASKKIARKCCWQNLINCLLLNVKLVNPPPVLLSFDSLWLPIHKRLQLFPDFEQLTAATPLWGGVWDIILISINSLCVLYVSVPAFSKFETELKKTQLTCQVATDELIEPELSFHSSLAVITWSNKNQLQLVYAPNHICVIASILKLFVWPHICTLPTTKVWNYHLKF